MNNSFYTVAEFLEHTANNYFTVVLSIVVLYSWFLFVLRYDQFHALCILDL
jgi:hypothetical protein